MQILKVRFSMNILQGWVQLYLWYLWTRKIQDEVFKYKFYKNTNGMIIAQKKHQLRGEGDEHNGQSEKLTSVLRANPKQFRAREELMSQ